MIKEKEIVVVIPVYRSILSIDESQSLAQCVKVLAKYQLVIVKPESLDVDFVTSKYAMVKVESFQDQCFSSLRSYNKLVLSETFYSRFEKYRYMLIYQLDAYVFKDELLLWANKNYDYIGAPWIPLKHSYLTRKGRFRIRLRYAMYTLLNNDRRKKDPYCNYQVGNGGFSLRKIEKMVEVIRFYRKRIDFYMDDDKAFYPEDVFLAVELTNRRCRLCKPSFSEALKFSMEENPAWCYNYNNEELPFGCHAWSHECYSPFWSGVIPKK